MWEFVLLLSTTLIQWNQRKKMQFLGSVFWTKIWAQIHVHLLSPGPCSGPESGPRHGLLLGASGTAVFHIYSFVAVMCLCVSRVIIHEVGCNSMWKVGLWVTPSLRLWRLHGIWEGNLWQAIAGAQEAGGGSPLAANPSRGRARQNAHDVPRRDRRRSCLAATRLL